jgi:hypothetical protein
MFTHATVKCVVTVGYRIKKKNWFNVRALVKKAILRGCNVNKKF